MAGEDIISMSVREIRRLKVVQLAIEGGTTQKSAASMLGLSERQVRRLVRSVRVQGERGIIHGSRDRPSNRRIDVKIKEKVLYLYKESYPDFGPTLATEKLLERDGIKISDETLRSWLLEAGIWQKRRKRSSHRRWRERKECFGEMVQMDGSHHDWLEGRGEKLVLIATIDDATNTVYGQFHDYEGTMPAMDSFRGYVRKYGLPISVYLDRHTTYKSPKQVTEWEKIEGIKPRSQFERALEELGVEVIHALSPQAKGRVERLFGVLQDRLVKEMRLNGIKTKDEANAFLEEYVPWYNKRFGICPAQEANAHVRLSAACDLDRYLCIKRGRTIRNDNTIALDGRLYQIEQEHEGKKVLVEERIDGSLHILSNSVVLKYKEITEKPKKEVVAKIDQRVYNRPRKPSQDHPWKKGWKNWHPTTQKGLYAY
jgi:transposase